MSGVLFIVVGILMFGVLIAVHELGHFASAKLLGVKVSEFAIGMGPKLWKKQRGETLYSLRLFPFGGFCAMEEDEVSDDPRAFTSARWWKRIIILLSGSVMNLVFGFLLTLILCTQIAGVYGNTVERFEDYATVDGAGGLMAGDTILRVNGERIYYRADFQMFLSLAGSDTVDLVILRDGQEIRLDGFTFERHSVPMEDGTSSDLIGIHFSAPPYSALRYAGYMTMNSVRLVRVSLGMLFSGQAGLRDLSGPVGIVAEMGKVGTEDGKTVGEGMMDVLTLGAFIAVNLAVMNLLPIPALDGGRIFLLLVTLLIEKITRKKLNPKYEGYIHAGAFILLIGLMIFTLFSDVVRVFFGK